MLRIKTIVLLIGISLTAITAEPATAADLEMVDAFGNVTGVVDVSRRGISVFENNGARWFYRRERRYDLPGGRYLGFYNLELNRAIRFPINGRGPIERADFDSPFPRFVPATVSVRPIGSGPVFAPYLEIWQVGGVAVSGTGLSVGPSGGYAFNGPTPVIPQPTLQPVIPGYSTIPRIGIGSQFGPSLGLRPTIAAPRSVLLESRLEANPVLPPVEVALLNRGPNRLQAQLIDATNPTKQVRYEIPAGGNQRVRLPRDSGQTRVRVFQTFDAIGQLIEQEVRDTIPPAPRFEVIVRRIQIQSIAIDRTGTSPNVIEDVNRQGIGVGRFWLPAGNQLQSGDIDLLARATSARNAGAIAPVDAN